MKTLLKKAREQKGLKTRELAQVLGIDQALISKFETGTRKPTKEQIVKLATLLEIDFETLMVAWLKEKILHEIGNNAYALKALNLVREELGAFYGATKNKLPEGLVLVLKEIDALKAKLDTCHQHDSSTTAKTLELEYTFESNRFEGNTLTLRETDLVINEGLTISGKSMREHLEAINHQEAIGHIKHLMGKNTPLDEREVLTIQNLLLRGIIPESAGRYRKTQAPINGSAYLPSHPSMLAKEMEDYFVWYKTNKESIHPLLLAAEMYERLVSIHPFTDGNERTSRLVMNYILLQHGFVIANLKGDYANRLQYNHALETAQTKNNKDELILFVAQMEKESLERYIGLIGQ